MDVIYNNLFIQLVGFVGTIFFFLSYQCRTNKNLFRVQLLSYICYTIHLFLLGAFTGGISYVLNAIRSICLGSKNKYLQNHMMCVLLCFLQLAALVFTWNGWISIFPVAANIAATIAGYTFNPQKIRIAGIFINSPLWIIYNIIIGSWAGILDEIVSEVSMGISIIRYGWNNLNCIEK